MEILCFTKKEEKECKEFINKYNNIEEFNILNITTFTSEKKKLFFMVDKGILKKYKLIAYCIVEEELKPFLFFGMIDKKYGEEGNIVFLSDFMVKISERNNGIGKMLAKYIIDEHYKNKTIILNPDDDGYWFWKKFGFVEDKISKHKTWILKRDLSKEKI